MEDPYNFPKENEEKKENLNYEESPIKEMKQTENIFPSCEIDMKVQEAQIKKEAELKEIE